MNNTKPFIIKCHDTLPALSVTIRSRGFINELIPFSLTGVTACTFSMTDGTGNLKVSSAQAQITSASGGTIQYNWASIDTDTDGFYSGEFELFFSDGNKMSVPTLGALDIHVVKDINGS